MLDCDQNFAKDTTEETPAASGAAQAGLRWRSWGVFAGVVFAFFWTVRWYENADVRSASAASTERYHVAFARKAIEAEILERLRPDRCNSKTRPSCRSGPPQSKK